MATKPPTRYMYIYIYLDVVGIQCKLHAHHRDINYYKGANPIGSMYAIYGNIYLQYTPNVSIYTIHGSYGYSHLFDGNEACIMETLGQTNIDIGIDLGNLCKNPHEIIM